MTMFCSSRQGEGRGRLHRHHYPEKLEITKERLGTENERVCLS